MKTLSMVAVGLCSLRRKRNRKSTSTTRMGSNAMKTLAMVAMMAVLFLGTAAKADLVWYADFDSGLYNPGDAPVTNDTTGADDTFSGYRPGTVLEIVGPTGNFQTGNALKMSNETTNHMRWWIRDNLPDMPSLMIVTMDIEAVGGYQDFNIRPHSDGAEIGYPTYDAIESFGRITAIANKTGSAITTPLGWDVPDGYIGGYIRYANGTYRDSDWDWDQTLVALAAGTMNGMKGRLNNVLDAEYSLLDNILIFDSLDEKLFRVDIAGVPTDVSILELMPGTTLGDQLPEPATLSLLTLGGLGVLLRRKRNRRGSGKTFLGGKMNRTLWVMSVVTLLLVGPAGAKVLWYADFESYDISGGDVSVTVDSSGDNNTMSQLQNETGATATSTVGNWSGASQYMVLHNLSDPPFTHPLDDLYCIQHKVDTFNAGDGVRVLSYDLKRTGSTGLNGEILIITSLGLTSQTQRGIYSGNDHQWHQPTRITVVMNRSGDASVVTMPFDSDDADSDPDTVADNSIAFYLYNASVGHVLLATESATFGNGTIGGFFFRHQTTTSNDPEVKSAGYDNILWADLEGQQLFLVDGVAYSILDLPFGTTLGNEMPEPATLGLLTLGGLGVLLRRKRNRRNSGKTNHGGIPMKSFLLIGMAAILIFGTAAKAEILWYADGEEDRFGNVLSPGDVFAPPVYGDGASQTFSGFQALSQPSRVLQMKAASIPSMGADNAIEWYVGPATGEGTNYNCRFFQTALPTFGAGSVFVLSYDADGYTSPGLYDSSNTRITANQLGGASSNYQRITVIGNRTGSPITLPDGLGTVADGEAVLYYRNATGFYFGGTQSISGDFNGFAEQLYRGAEVSAYYDNFMISDSLDGNGQLFLVDGVAYSFLELPAGASMADELPEPATMGLLAIGGLSVLLRRRKSRA